MTLAVVTGAWIILAASAAICLTRANRTRIRFADQSTPVPGASRPTASDAPVQLQPSTPQRDTARSGTAVGEAIPQVRTVPQHTAEATTYDVACSACGILASRTLAEAAEEEARWHRTRGWHHAMHSSRAPDTTPRRATRADIPGETS